MQRWTTPHSHAPGHLQTYIQGLYCRISGLPGVLVAGLVRICSAERSAVGERATAPGLQRAYEAV